MSRAAWWWASDKAVTVEAPPALDPPDVVSPGDQTYYVGEVIDLTINNAGGAASSWTVGDLPSGLTTDEYPDRLHIHGTVT